MTTTFLLLLMISITAAAFIFGIALSYWIICAILKFFNPARTPKKPARNPAFAPSQ